MQTTTRNLTSLRVAATRSEALAWLARRLDWEDRLRDLRSGGPAASVRRPRALALRPVDGGHAPVARAS